MKQSMDHKIKISVNETDFYAIIEIKLTHVGTHFPVFFHPSILENPRFGQNINKCKHYRYHYSF